MEIPGRTGSADNRPYFFLSYAHTPRSGASDQDPDYWVHKLFRDLCDHIMALTDLPAGTPAGFIDREMRSGQGWPERLSENLATCRVFVPLLSARYFASEDCGREWYAFNDRMRAAKDRGARSVDAIVPALWTHVGYDQLPDSISHIHLERNAFGIRYATTGFYGLMKLNRYLDEYEEAVLGLAHQIVRAANDSPLAPCRPRPYATTPSAFKPRGHGPRHIRLTVAAPTVDDLPVHRDRTPYGDDPQDWNPYHRESTRPLSELAEEAIRSLDYRVTVTSFDDEDTGGPAPQPAEGEAPPQSGAEPEGPQAGHPGILLIDPWALTEELRRRRLKAYDSTAPAWTNAIVPWCRRDAQCQSEEGEQLTEELYRTLPGILERGRRTDCRIAVNGVPSLKAFNDVLPAVVANSTRHYMRNAEASPPPGPKYTKPRLEGPVSGALLPEPPDHGGAA